MTSPGEEPIISQSSSQSSNGETASASVTIPTTELEKLEKEAAEYRDKYLRLLAEGENTRKRMQKEREEMILYAVENLIVDFLDPIDHFENALQHMENASPEVKHWAVGFQMILKQLKDVLSNNGATTFQSVGKQFDPHQHEAVEMVATTEHPEGTIIVENVRGYKMGNRTIRPARVKVAKKPEESAQEG